MPRKSTSWSSSSPAAPTSTTIPASVRSSTCTTSTRPRAVAAPKPTRNSDHEQTMTDPALGLTMLALIVIVIMMGFPTAFTLMGLGMFFGFMAFYQPGHPWTENRIFDLMVERAYGAMNNESLI